MASSSNAGPKRIRVLFAVSTLGGGGAERQVLAILKHLNRERFEPLLYLIERRGELIDEVAADVKVFTFAERQPHTGLYFPGRIHLRQITDMGDVIREQQVDVLYERMYFMSMIGAAVARQQAVKRIAVIDSNPRFDLPRTGGRFLILKRRLLRRAYSEATRTIAVSQCVRRKTAEYYRLPLEKIQTSFNFLETERIDELAAQAAPAWSKDRCHLLGLGRLQGEKGFHLLLEALHLLVHQRQRGQLMLHLAGTGPQQEQLQTQVRQLDLGQHVQFHGFVSNPYPLLKRADLFCLSSLYEGLPTALLEAMLCRTPVLATRCECGPDEILLGGQYGRLVAPGSSEALAQGIEAALFSGEPSRAGTEQARQHVLDVYGRVAGMQRAESLLQEVAVA